MKQFILLIVLLINYQSILSQENIGIVDIGKLVSNHPQKQHYDSIYNVCKKNLSDTLKNLEIKFNYIVNDGYLGYGQRRQLLEKKSLPQDSILRLKEKEINLLSEKIANFAENSKNKLKNLEKKHASIMEQDILQIVRKYAKQNNYKYILKKASKPSFVYLQTRNNITNEILKLIFTE